MKEKIKHFFQNKEAVELTQIGLLFTAGIVSTLAFMAKAEVYIDRKQRELEILNTASRLIDRYDPNNNDTEVNQSTQTDMDTDILH
jgi:hypothetical protein